jgi:cyclopropane fatty-acyl-phospholipid synthase-like methyltransferase
LKKRFADKQVEILEDETLMDLDARIGRDYYDLIVAVDVIEHFHPDEFEDTLDSMNNLRGPDGVFYLHNNFREAEEMPQAFDHAAEFDEWCQENGIIAPDTPYGIYRRNDEALRVERLQEQTT